VIVVSDTSPITNLAAIGQLDLLRRLYQNVIIPAAVYSELIAAGGSYPGAIVQSLDWVEVRDVANRLLVTALRIELDEARRKQLR
jgi:predicted nucleic acid-binding protein